MKRRALHKIATSSLILVLQFTGMIQSQVTEPLLSLQNTYNEHYTVFTDRNLYIAGEWMYFSVTNFSDDKLKSVHWSHVYYLELIKPDGSVVIKAKFPLSVNGTEGAIQIPVDIPTGNYYLRSYTRWMRNFSTAFFAYNGIKIINPAIKDMEYMTVDTFQTTTAILLKTKPRSIPVPEICSTDKSIYHDHEKVVLSIEIPRLQKYALNRYCITVVRTGALNLKNFGVLWAEQTSDGSGYYSNYIPDQNGLSISGKIFNTKTSEVVQNAIVQLAALGNGRDYLSYKTGSDGSFCFSLLPATGKQDLYITARSIMDDQLEIRIDNDFANHNQPIYTRPFDLSDKEKALAVEMMINAQVNRIYAKDSFYAEVPGEKVTLNGDFYGTPLRTVFIADFVSLPTLDELFFELVPEVNIVKRKGETYMVLNGNQRNNTEIASFNPLILLDRVPISNLKDLLEVSPDKIQRIEILNDLYIKGSFIYGGIVSIFSKKSDLAGVNLPQNSYFFDFSGFSPQPVTRIFNNYISDAHSRIPDLRNCLYWNPDVILKPETDTSLVFYTSDSKGDFEVIVRGVTSTGDILEGSCKFRVE